MNEPTKVPNDEFLEELKGYVDQIPEGLAGAFALQDGSEPFAVVMGIEAWSKTVKHVNDLSDRLDAAEETIEISQDNYTLDSIAESLASLSDEDLADVYLHHTASQGSASWTKKLYDPISDGVKNFMNGPNDTRQIPVDEYEDMQKRISRQRKANFQLEEKYAELLQNFDDLRASFDLLDSENDKLTEEAEYWSHKYDMLVGAVNAVRSINIEAL